jgi:hypothetical protein
LGHDSAATTEHSRADKSTPDKGRTQEHPALEVVPVGQPQNAGSPDICGPDMCRADMGRADMDSVGMDGQCRH